MKKNFLFFLSNGLITPYYVSQMALTGHISIVMCLTALVSGVSALYLSKFSNKIHIGIFIATASLGILLMPYLIGQILYGVSVIITCLLINIKTSKDKNTELSFGKLTFYTEIAYAISLLVGGVISTTVSIPVAIGLMIAFVVV